MERMRKTFAVMLVLILVFVPVGCTSNKSGVDASKHGGATTPTATTAQKAKDSQETSSLIITTVDPVTVKKEIEKDLKPIKEVYKDDFLIGTAISAKDLTGDRYDLLKMHFNVTTAENEMKPIALQPEKGKFDFSGADTIMDKVLASGMQMYGHTLVLDKQTPAWMNKDTKGNPLGRKEALGNMRIHIKTVMEHFGNKVISWDVVNDAMSEHPTHPQDWKASLHPSPWLDAIGEDYVEQAFLAAREVLDAHSDWDIKLYYNDYNVDNQNKALAVYNMVKEINKNYQKKHPGKLLIDGIGMEGHFNLDTNPEKVEKSLEKFESLGVEISISELDSQAISMQSKGLYIWETGTQGAFRWADLFNVFRAHAKNIKRISFWGMADGESWMTMSSVLLFNENLQARGAYFGVTDQLAVLCKRFP